ncbi:MAG TPA: ATP-binding cassette domain-containing protein [Woeseiaceae bacterium]|nr:ATP-binding cassette domain-containing protein [Woeseiaceae bacterium]
MTENTLQQAPSAAEFRNVTLRRGTVTALDDLTLTLPGRKTTAVLGASGSGKSTLIQLTIGLLRPDRGTVSTLGAAVDYDKLRPLRKRIGYAIQDICLYPHLDIRDNILLPARLDGRDEQECAARLDELLTLMQLPEDVLPRWPHELSGGQQQRAGLCRAMILRPELLLLDEPFSGLDTMTRSGIHDQFLQLQDAEPVSSILVTHDPQEAINLADFIVVIREGRVQQHGPVDDVVSNPVNEYVDHLCTGLTGIAR